MAPAGVTPTQNLLGATAVLCALALAATPFMLRQHRSAPAGGAGLSLPRGPLLLLGVMAGLGLVGEGAMYDWSVLYLTQEVGAPTSIASMGYASFSGAMAAGRFGGDWVRARVRPAPLLRASGVLAALGMVLALAVPHPMAALAGFALVGLGFANMVPVLFSAAGQLPGIAPAQGIAAVASVGYFDDGRAAPDRLHRRSAFAGSGAAGGRLLRGGCRGPGAAGARWGAAGLRSSSPSFPRRREPRAPAFKGCTRACSSDALGPRLRGGDGMRVRRRRPRTTAAA
jgi:hypothetical protein